MSFEIWCQGFSAAGADGAAPDEVLRVFGADVNPDTFGFYRVPCQMGACELLLTIENGVATGITIVRPCAGDDLSRGC